MPTIIQCLLFKVNELGYAVTSNDRDGAFIQAVRQTSGVLGLTTASVLQIWIYESADKELRSIYIMAGKEKHKGPMLGTGNELGTPDDKGRTDAREILMVCGDGPITQQRDTFEASAVE